jgi:hypothetical protein
MPIKINKKIIFLLGVIFVAGFLALSAEASTVAWQKIKTDNPKQVVFVLHLDTAGQRENAWSGQINFDSRQLKLLSISDARSLVSLWLERPSEKTLGQISFSGITPGGFVGSGELFKLIFSATGASSPSLTNFEALLGDGSGQKAKVTLSPQISIINSDPNSTDFGTDKTAPELAWQLTQESLISSGWQLTATAFDKQSGIRYLAMATTSDYLAWGDVAKRNGKLNWQKIEGPQILSSGELRHVVFLKSVDNAGNVKLVKLYPIRAYLFVLLCIIIIVLILFLFL